MTPMLDQTFYRAMTSIPKSPDRSGLSTKLFAHHEHFYHIPVVLLNKHFSTVVASYTASAPPSFWLSAAPDTLDSLMVTTPWSVLPFGYLKTCVGGKCTRSDLQKQQTVCKGSLDGLINRELRKRSKCGAIENYHVRKPCERSNSYHASKVNMKDAFVISLIRFHTNIFRSYLFVEIKKMYRRQRPGVPLRR